MNRAASAGSLPPLLALVALAWGCAHPPPSSAARAEATPAATAEAAAAEGRVTATEARALVQAGARLVDVRTLEDFDAGHLPGAIHLPLETLGERATSELAPLDAPVVVYCNTGNRSGRATELLRSLGFTEVHDLGPKPKP